MKLFTGIFGADIAEIEDSRQGAIMLMDSPNDYQSYIDHHKGNRVTVTIKPESKSTEKERMYAYYHKVILGCTIMALTNDGWTGVDEVVADAYLKQNVAQSLTYDKKGDVVLKYLKDKSSMNKEELCKFISDAIYLLEERHQVTCPDADQYRMQNWK